MKKYKIFVINPGSTSTKLALYENATCLLSTNVFHDSSVLIKFPKINDQLMYRMMVIQKFIEDNHVDLTGVDAVVGRGGSCYAVESGIYEVSDQLLQDTREAKGGLYHVSMLGVQLARMVADEYGGRVFMMDPPIVDELCDEARLTGVSGIYRKAVSHALNEKACAKHHARVMHQDYDQVNYIVCHIDGGISITAHRHGRMIDGNDAGGGEGPFTPTRMGSMAVTDMLLYFKDKSPEDIRKLCYEAGGLSSYFHTSDADVIHRMVDEGDEKATLVWQAMIYQIVKYIGAMSTALKGQVDAILLTGGLLRFDDITDTIRKDCGWIAPVYAYPGEFEQDAMAQGALRVLRGEEQLKEYTGKPVWSGFDWD
ncbi:MAG: butyrate kinase [Catenisphaera adipataccumulans]|jgi:butyrate kinase|uniref:butyrate kinase n=1 Tax=Catenisphaera adipataccumulans TaxID=700500 RepID=UPI003D941617